MKIKKVIHAVGVVLCMSSGLVIATDAAVKAGHQVSVSESKTTVDADTKTRTTTVTTSSTAHANKAKSSAQINATDATHASMQTSATKLNSAVTSSFSSWVGTDSKTGKPNTELTTADLETQLKNPKINGQDAAALAAIAVRTNSLTAWNPQSLASINQKLAKSGLSNAFPNASYGEATSKSWAGVTVTLIPVAGSNPATYTTKISYTLKQLQADISEKNSALYRRYEETVNNLRGSFYTDGRINLYGGKRTALPPVSAIRQGGEGDCYFVSSVEALLNSNPTQIKNMIQPVSGNTYTVTFPGKAPITVTPTRSEVAMFSYVQGGGGWLAIIAVAADKALKDSSNMVNIIHGGYPYQVLSLLTGVSYKAVSLTDASHDPDASTAQVNTMLSTAFSTSPLTPIGVEVSDHALSITHYTPANPNSNPATVAMVTIQNPWGTNGDYTTPNGTHLTMSHDGQITIPVADLAKDGFVAITAPTTLIPS